MGGLLSRSEWDALGRAIYPRMSGVERTAWTAAESGVDRSWPQGIARLCTEGRPRVTVWWAAECRLKLERRREGGCDGAYGVLALVIQISHPRLDRMDGPVSVLPGPCCPCILAPPGTEHEFMPGLMADSWSTVGDHFFEMFAHIESRGRLPALHFHVPQAHGSVLERTARTAWHFLDSTWRTLNARQHPSRFANASIDGCLSVLPLVCRRRHNLASSPDILQLLLFVTSARLLAAGSCILSWTASFRQVFDGEGQRVSVMCKRYRE